MCKISMTKEELEIAELEGNIRVMQCNLETKKANLAEKNTINESLIARMDNSQQ